MYDIIGDIHGHARELRALLEQLGYRDRYGVYRHTARKAVFVGDFVDRGPAIRETLQTVRAMVDQGAALAVMGNHEFNAICYHTSDGADGHLRSRTAENNKNSEQHQETLDQLVIPYPDEWQSYLAWFKSLPLFLELEGLRVVHAAWDPDAIRVVRGRSLHDPEFLRASATEGKAEYDAVTTLLKGPEVRLPQGWSNPDKQGHNRRREVTELKRHVLPQLWRLMRQRSRSYSAASQRPTRVSPADPLAVARR